jgi:hypothetical protein
MTASHAPVLDAIAFQLAAALERYEQDVGRMMDTWLDMDLYREVSRQVEEIRMYSAALPQLSASWLEVLIAHAELIHHMWRVQNARPAPQARDLAAVRERHAAAVRRLHDACLRLIARSGEHGAI